MTPEEFRQKQRNKIQQVRQQQAALAQQAAAWDPIITPMLQKIGEQVWGSAARVRHWHGEWEVHAATPAHPRYRLSLRLDEAGEPSHFVVKCAAGDLETQSATESALTETLQQAVAAGPTGWP
jgi:hypothetical protein